jgi:uncharacterized membrane protein
VAALDVPRLKGHVNDYAGMLSPASVRQLEALLTDFEQKESTQIALLTVPSLAGRFAGGFLHPGRRGLENRPGGNGQWRHPADRQSRPQDSHRGRLRAGRPADRSSRRENHPQCDRTALQRGAFDQGIAAGISAMIDAVRGEFSAGESPPPPRPKQRGIPLLPLLAIFFLINALGRASRALGAAAGGVLAPVAGGLFFGLGPMLLLALIPVGIAAGLLVSLIGGPLSMGHGGRRGGYWGGGFGGRFLLRRFRRLLGWRRRFRRRRCIGRMVAGGEKNEKSGRHIFIRSGSRADPDSTVAAAEKKTAGEIVCMVVSSSYHYPLANVLGATAAALPASLLGTHFLGAWLWIGSQNMWLFLGLFTICFALFHWVVERFPALKRRFISRREIDEEVEEAAINAFFRQGLYRTRDANGVLLFISVFEHKVWLLADRGIHEKVTQDDWDALVDQCYPGHWRGPAHGGYMRRHRGHRPASRSPLSRQTG